MKRKTKAVLIASGMVLAIGGPVYMQQREIRKLREELATLQATAPQRKAGIAAPAAAIPQEQPRNAAPVNGVPDNSVHNDAITQNTRRLGGRRGAGATAFIPAAEAGVSGPLLLTEVTGEWEGNLAPAGLVTGMDLTRSVPMVAGKVYWDHAQATGAPDTREAGDRPTAWAPLQAGSGEQWLQLGYDKAVELKEVNIHETYNPGAISKVSALMADGSEQVIWQGTAVKAGSAEESLETSVPVPPGITASQVRIYVDTDRVGSWPEIDAVELVGTSGLRQWASRSSASSSYSANYSGRSDTTAR